LKKFCDRERLPDHPSCFLFFLVTCLFYNQSWHSREEDQKKTGCVLIMRQGEEVAKQRDKT
jgi:hypothetical protein